MGPLEAPSTPRVPTEPRAPVPTTPHAQSRVTPRECLTCSGRWPWPCRARPPHTRAPTPYTPANARVPHAAHARRPAFKLPGRLRADSIAYALLGFDAIQCALIEPQDFARTRASAPGVTFNSTWRADLNRFGRRRDSPVDINAFVKPRSDQKCCWPSQAGSPRPRRAGAPLVQASGPSGSTPGVSSQQHHVKPQVSSCADITSLGGDVLTRPQRQLARPAAFLAGDTARVLLLHN